MCRLLTPNQYHISNYINALKLEEPTESIFPFQVTLKKKTNKQHIKTTSQITVHHWLSAGSSAFILLQKTCLWADQGRMMKTNLQTHKICQQFNIPLLRFYFFWAMPTKNQQGSCGEITARLTYGLTLFILLTSSVGEWAKIKKLDPQLLSS